MVRRAEGITPLSLADLRLVSKRMVLFAESLNRPLLHRDKEAYKWILAMWDSPQIEEETADFSEQECHHVTLLIEQVRRLFEPDPVERIHIERNLDGMMGTPNNGKRVCLIPTHAGIKERPLGTREINERFDMLQDMVSGIGTLARELGTPKIPEDVSRCLLRNLRWLARQLSKKQRRMEWEQPLLPMELAAIE